MAVGAERTLLIRMLMIGKNAVGSNWGLDNGLGFRQGYIALSMDRPFGVCSLHIFEYRWISCGLEFEDKKFIRCC